jgi:hypothetical protein
MCGFTVIQGASLNNSPCAVFFFFKHHFQIVVDHRAIDSGNNSTRHKHYITRVLDTSVIPVKRHGLNQLIAELVLNLWKR